MKKISKISLFWWIFWLLWSFEATGPELVEAGSKPTYKSKNVYSRTGPDGRTETTIHQHKEWDRRYQGGSSGPSRGPTYDVQPGDIVPVITCVFTFGLVCPSSSSS